PNYRTNRERTHQTHYEKNQFHDQDRNPRSHLQFLAFVTVTVLKIPWCGIFNTCINQKQLNCYFKINYLCYLTLVYRLHYPTSETELTVWMIARFGIGRSLR